MGKILGLLGALIPVISGIYCIVYFGGYKTPKFDNNTGNEEMFNNLKKNHKKKIVILAIFLIIWGIIQALKILL